MTQEELQDVNDYLKSIIEDVVSIRKQLKSVEREIESIQDIVGEHCNKCGEQVISKKTVPFKDTAMCGGCAN